MRRSKIKIFASVCLACALFLVSFLTACDDGRVYENTDQWTVVLDFNDNVSRNGTLFVDKTKSVELPDDPVRKGYAFAGWTTEDGADVPFVYTPMSDVKLSAKWNAGSCSVTFDMNYEEGESLSRSVEYGKFVDDPPVPAREGFVFRFWSVSPEGEEVDFASYPVKGDYKFYAIWRDADIREFTVTFDSGAYDGAPALRSVTVLQGERVKTSDVPKLTRRGYKLRGWTAEKPESADWTIDVYPAANIPEIVKIPFTPERSEMLYAVWTIEEYTAVFNINYTDSLYEDRYGVYHSYKLLSNEKVSPPTTDPTRENYVFVGWYTAARGGDKVDFESGFTLGANAGYYAHWQHVGVHTDLFHAEYVEFDPNQVYWGYSGSVKGAECIVKDTGAVGSVRMDEYPLNSKLTARYGYYVSYQYEKGNTLRFEINVSKPTTATLIGSFAIEGNKVNAIGPDGEFSNLIKVNGESVNYAPMRLQNTFAEYAVGTIRLNEGLNVIELVVNNSSGIMGGTYKAAGFMTDYIRLSDYGDATLTWSPVYDNLEVLVK